MRLKKVIKANEKSLCSMCPMWLKRKRKRNEPQIPFVFLRDLVSLCLKKRSRKANLLILAITIKKMKSVNTQELCVLCSYVVNKKRIERSEP